ncbi:hypothetical protein PIB30_048699 [Stylosanthes scabra]|uniref:Uncharacterized protein n=1 Tax=Stylosanthes scabra TaxID=79078 RepID=A0ABU6SHC5_9FABA|nr:hypothetical protein [Stylosanthes scabra]
MSDHNTNAYLFFVFVGFLLSSQVFSDELSQEKKVPTHNVVFDEIEGLRSSNFDEWDTTSGYYYHPSARRVRVHPPPPIPPSRMRRLLPPPSPSRRSQTRLSSPPPRRWRPFHGPNPNRIDEKEFPHVPEPKALPPLPRPPSFL